MQQWDILNPGEIYRPTMPTRIHIFLSVIREWQYRRLSKKLEHGRPVAGRRGGKLKLYVIKIKAFLESYLSSKSNGHSESAWTRLSGTSERLNRQFCPETITPTPEPTQPRSADPHIWDRLGAVSSKIGNIKVDVKLPAVCSGEIISSNRYTKTTMIVASSPDQVTISYRGNRYRIHDAYPSREMAEEYAYELRSAKRSLIHAYGRCGAVVVDLTPAAGRLRYGIFVRHIK